MKNTTLVACILFATQLIYSQETIAASGGEALGSGGTVSYTLGQVFYTSLTSGNGTTLSEGVQQYKGKTTYDYNNVWTPRDPNGEASANDDIVITLGDAVIHTNTTCNMFTIRPGAGVIIDTEVTLTPIGGLTLESNSISYSSIIPNGTGAVSRTVSYQRFVNSNSLGNDLISAPLADQLWLSFLDPVNADALLDNGGSPTTIYAFAPFNKTTGDFQNYDNTTSALLTSGTGYRSATDTGTTLTFTGAIPTSTVSVNIVNSGPSYAEWNLIGNPYPSYLKVQDFLNHDVGGVTNLELFEAGSAAIYGYDGSGYNTNSILNLANTTASSLIAPGQGFFVSADATNASLYNLQFTKAMRSTGTGDDFIASREAELVFVKLNASTNTDSFTTDIYFNSNASLGFDLGYDAKIFGSTPSFAIYSHLVEDNDGTAIAIQTLNSTDVSDVSIPLGVNANQGEQITFSVADTTLPESVNIYLDDTVADTSTLLNTSDYVISPTTALSGTGRFFLRTTNNALSTIENNLDALNIFVLNSSKELIVSGQLQQNTILDLYDIQGRKVLSNQLDSSMVINRISISSLSVGVYVAKVFNSSQIKTQKLIIK